MGFGDLVRLKLREMEEPLFDPALSGARTYQTEKVSGGFNLFDGRLIGIDGNVARSWGFRYLGLILPDGRYLAQEYYESEKWGMFTWDDLPIWISSVPIHHDIILTPQNTIITFTKEMHPYHGREVDFCVIAEFDLNGKETSRWSSWDRLKEIQKFHAKLELDRPKLFFLPETAKRKEKTPWGGHYDYYRLNALQVLPDTELGSRDKRFQAGNWLVSFRHGSMLFILDKDTRNIVWKCIDNDIPGRLEGQHAPQMLLSGNILIFDNGRYRGWSRAIELDPVTLKIVWEYRAANLFTLSQGYVQRLPNGNTLITESERGRAFEVTPAKEVVWEYYHPERQDASNSTHPESYGKRQWIYRMVRYDPSFLKPFMSENEK
jgi:hypothetical protein